MANGLKFNNGANIRKVADFAEAETIQPVDGEVIYIQSADGKGNNWQAVTGAAPLTYTSNGGSFCGTTIIPTGGDGSSAWLRDYSGAVNVNWMGAAGTNDSTAFTNALAVAKHIFIPNGTYPIKDVSVGSNTIIEFESITAVVTGVTTADDCFISTGSITNVQILNGKFDSCNNGYFHTGNSALNTSVFSNISFTNLVAGIDLSSSVGNTFTNNVFGLDAGTTNIQYGVRFRKSGSGQTNINSFYSNRYLHFAVAGVSYDDSVVVAFGNNHYNDWFEDALVNGLYIGGNTQLLTLFGGYFETCGSATESDITIENVLGGGIRSIVFNNVNFASSNSSQTSRIKTIGNASFDSNDCNVTLATGQVFAELTGASSSWHTSIMNTRLNAVGGGTYESRLFSRSATQQVSWNTYVGSGYVTEDLYPSRKMLGPDLSNITTFLSTDATPSVHTGNIFKTAGTTTITDFDDGRVGQTIQILAGNTITITASTDILLNGGVDFVMTLTDTLTLTMFNDQIWSEVGRSVN